MSVSCYYCGSTNDPNAARCTNCGNLLVLEARYRLLGVLGKGGFGLVYQAQDLRLNRLCAIKQVSASSRAEEERVTNEVDILAQHASRLTFIPTIYDTWSAPPHIYMVMEYIDGPGLDELLATRWPPEQVETFLHILLTNLVLLHAARIIHRDLKPANIKYTAEGRCPYMLLDFGLSKRDNSSSMKALSPQYAPPEQMQERPTDERSDLYSLAATAYHLLTGCSPVQAQIQANGRLPAPSELAPDTGPGLEAVVLQMLEQDMAKRPPDAATALALLERATPDLSERPRLVAPPHVGPARPDASTPNMPTVAADEPAPPGEPDVPAADMPTVSAAAFAETLTLPSTMQRALALLRHPGALGAWLTRQPGRWWRALLLALDELLARTTDLAPAYRLAFFVVPLLIFAGALLTGIALAQMPAQPAATLAVATPTPLAATPPANPTLIGPANLPPLATADNATRTTPVVSPTRATPSVVVVRLTPTPGAAQPPAPEATPLPTVAPESRAAPAAPARIAFASDRSGAGTDIYVMDADGTGLRQLTSSPATDSNPAWSPDGRTIAFASQRDGNAEIYLMAADGSTQRRLVSTPGDDWHPVWSPDGRTIAFQSRLPGNWDIYAVDRDGANLRNLTSSPANDIDPAWSPDGRTIAFASQRDGGEHEVYLMDADGANPRPITSSTGSNTSPAWSPDGQWIAFTSSRDGNAEIYRMAADGSGLRNLTTTPAVDTAPVWSPDGQWIAFVSGRDDNSEIYLMAADGSGLRNLTDTPAADFEPGWSP